MPQRQAQLRHCTLTRAAGQAIADPPSTAQSAAVDEGALLDCVVVGGGISGLVTAQVKFVRTQACRVGAVKHQTCATCL